MAPGDGPDLSARLFREVQRRDPYIFADKAFATLRLKPLHFALELRPWLDDFLLEITCLPNARNDDQVDSFAQALIWMRQCFQYQFW